jgi:hypothetical protein
MINFVLIGLFIITFVGGFALGFTLGIISTMQIAHAQTPTVINPDNPVSGLKFLDQKAYVYTIPPLEAQQQQSNNSLTDMLIPLIASAGGIIGAKIHSDRKTSKVATVVQETVLPEVVKTKEATKELARVTYDMNPEAAAKITDAPAVKLETLNEDTAQFAEKAAKTSLP